MVLDLMKPYKVNCFYAKESSTSSTPRLEINTEMLHNYVCHHQNSTGPTCPYNSENHSFFAVTGP